MDALEDAIDDFTHVYEFYEEWISSIRKLSKNDEELLDESTDNFLFMMTMKRHVSIAKKFAVYVFRVFDGFVVEANRNPFVVKRPGKRNKKLSFGRKKYVIDVEIHPSEIFPLFDNITRESFTTKQLIALNKLYDATVSIVRLKSFLDELPAEPTVEKGEQVVVEVMTNQGKLVKGLLTLSPNGSAKKEINAHLKVIDSSRNMCGLEVNFIGEVEFNLKIILAKLKRMRAPYVTPISEVVKIEEEEVPTQVPVPAVIPLPDVSLDVPPEGVTAATEKIWADMAQRPMEIGGGDTVTSTCVPIVGFEGCPSKSVNFEWFPGPFANYPEPDDSDDGEEELEAQPVPDRIEVPLKHLPHNYLPKLCAIQ